jgi:phosphatidylglycerophosphate synthase
VDAPSAAPIGAKKRDYWWTVLVVDPVALPLVRLLARKRWLTPDQVTLVSLLFGLPVGLAYASGRIGLVVGAVLFYLSFVFDCVDGKLARALDISSPRGRALDQIADGARRASAAVGLAFYLWRSDGPETDLLWIAVFGILSFYFMEISGAEKRDPASRIGGRWAEALGRRRLLPTPGMPDVSAIVYVVGPLTGSVVPAIAVGLAMIGVAILLTIRRLLRG